MKKLTTITSLLILGLLSFSLNAQESLTIKDASDNVLMEVREEGVIITKVTTSERATIAGNLGTSDDGLLVYDTDTESFWVWKGTNWEEVGKGDDLGDHKATQNLQLAGRWLSGDGGNEGLSVRNSGNVGVGTIAPISKFSIRQSSNTTRQGLRIENATNSHVGVAYMANTGFVINSREGGSDNLILNKNGGTVGIGVSSLQPDNSAILDISSTTKGVLLPRLTNAQREAIANPTTGLMIFNTNANKIQIKTNNYWVNLSTSACSKPGNGGAPSGPTNVSRNSTQTYYAPNISGATSYTWTYPLGTAIISGQGTKKLVIAFGPNAQSGTIHATPTNDCGTGTAAGLIITVN